MNNDLMYEYLLSAANMAPEEEELLRRQAIIDELRKRGETSPTGQMVGDHYVAPSVTQYAAQMMNAYNAARGQKDINTRMGSMAADRQQTWQEMKRRMDEERKRKMGLAPMTAGTPGPDAAFQGITGYTPWSQ